MEAVSSDEAETEPDRDLHGDLQHSQGHRDWQGGGPYRHHHPGPHRTLLRSSARIARIMAKTHPHPHPYEEDHLNVHPYKEYAPGNVAVKLINRETFGSFTRRGKPRDRKIFDQIPPRLRFCLMDMIPTRIKNHHIFMGFSQCGQFLLSFTCVGHAHMTRRRPFAEGFKFRLHFLAWVPGRKVRSVHSVPLFDDDSVDNRVRVSMAQWKHNPSLLVVYGIAEISTENSYLSVIGVPRLGCRKCASLSNSTEDRWNHGDGNRCIEHNFAIHTKFYCAAESPICEPVVQLAYNNQIVIYTDFIHILEIDLINPDKNVDDSIENRKFTEEVPQSYLPNSRGNEKNDEHKTSPVVQSILADFSDMEVESCVNVKPVQVPDMITHEVFIQAYLGPQSSAGGSEVYVGIEDSWESVPSPRTLISPPLRSPRRRPTEGLSRFNDMNRIAEKTYEFVEETEIKCEKLSIFRRRRLAEKKYEFSEENTENIVPFRVLRSNKKYYIGNSSKSTSRAKSPSEGTVLRVHNQINLPPVPLFSSEMKCDMVNSPSVLSDNTSEIEYRVTAMEEDGSLKTVAVHDNSSKTLSDFKVHPQDPYLVHSGNSNCSKHFTRRFIESDDDITSVLTDSEDDCLSGYHVALPLAAHGAGYAPLQPVSMGTWERLRVETPVVLQASQRSLDIELLCNEVCLRLCRLDNKKFVYCFDWGCHVINVCSSSGCICGVCAMWLWASDVDTLTEEDLGTFYLLNKRQYAAECLFVWDLVSGVYRTEHVSFKEDSTHDTSRASGSERARQIALELAPVSTSFGQETRLLTTLTAGKSLKKLTDFDHFVELTRHNDGDSESRTDNSESQSEMSESQSDSSESHDESDFD